MQRMHTMQLVDHKCIELQSVHCVCQGVGSHMRNTDAGAEMLRGVKRRDSTHEVERLGKTSVAWV